MSNVMGVTHKPSMNLRFVLRVLPGHEQPSRILQQMFVPHDWNTHDEEWRDVPLAAEQQNEVKK